MELISREKVIEDICSIEEVGYTRGQMADRLKGKWIRDFNGTEFYWYCSNCKANYYEEDLYMGGTAFPNFCPNCGADMRGEE